MGEVINLGRARKAREKDKVRAKAAENRAAHGRTRAEKALEKAKAEVERRRLEQARRERPDEEP